MSGTISLTPSEQHDLTTALRLEAAGFPEAARWLRSHIMSLRLLGWDDPVPEFKAEDIAQWIALFRAHRGSAPPHQSITLANARSLFSIAQENLMKAEEGVVDKTGVQAKDAPV